MAQNKLSADSPASPVATGRNRARSGIGQARGFTAFGLIGLGLAGVGAYAGLAAMDLAQPATGIAIGAVVAVGALAQFLAARGDTAGIADLVVDYIQIPVIVSDGAHNILRFNPACATLSGYSMAELSDPVCWLGMLLPEERAAVAAATDAASDAPFPRRLENYWITKSGQRRLLRWTSSPLIDDVGDTIAIVSVGTDITEIRQAETQSRRSESVLRRAHRIAHLGHWTWSPTDGVTAPSHESEGIYYYSHEAAQIFGVTHEALNSGGDELYASLLHPDDRQEAMQAYRSYFGSSKEQLVQDYRIRRPDGAPRHLRVMSQKFYSDQGHVLEVTGIVQDLTEIRRAELAIRQVQMILTAAQKVAGIGYWFWDQAAEAPGPDQPDTSFHYSAEAQAVSGISEQLMQAMPTADFCQRFVIAADRAHVLDIYTRFTDGEIDQYTLEYGFLHPTRGERVLRSVALRERDSAGHSLHATGMIQDITEFRQVEADIRLAHQSLANAQRIAHVGNWSRDLETGWVHWSDEVFRILGHEPQAFQPTLDHLIAAVHPGDREKLDTAIAGCIKDRAAYVTDHRILRPDGTLRHVREQGEASFDENGKLRRLEGVLLDITEIKARETALNEARLRAETADRAKTEFLGNMSHELRTPLNAVIGFADVLSQQLFGPIPEAYNDSIAAISQSGRNLLEIINDLLEMSRIESGERRLLEQIFDPLAAIADCIRQAEIPAKNSEITLVIEHEGPLPLLNGEERAFKQALNNLISNALKFTPLGGKVAVRTVADVANGLIVTVSDTGPGIDPALLSQLGKPFQQGEHSHARRYGGIGLGLAISSRLMDMHGGRLDIDSALGQGARVSLIFPKERLSSSR